MRISYVISLCLVALVNAAIAQDENHYNLNIYNGLPSNHNYDILRDRFGYLWVSTEKGVVRYNGYELKVFGLADGMANDDVWELFEDRKGRIWLYSISTELGYLFNERYHKVFCKSVIPRFYPLPTSMDNDSFGISFINNAETESAGARSICLERNDTLYRTELKVPPAGSFFLSENRDIYCNFENTLYKLVYNNGNYVPVMLCHDSLPKNLFADYIFKHYIIIVNRIDAELFILDVKNCIQREMLISRKERYYTFYEKRNDRNATYLITNKNIYKFDTSLRIVDQYSCSRFAPPSAGNLTNFFDDDFWGKVAGTVNGGFYFTYSPSKFKKEAYRLWNYKYVGSSASSAITFWWNPNIKSFACLLKKNGSVKYFNEILFHNVEKILPFNSKRSLLFADANIYWLYDHGGKKLSFETINEQMRIGAIDGFKNDSDYYIIQKNGGFYRFRASNVQEKLLDNYRYTGISYDSFRNYFWVYDDHRISVYNGEKLILTYNQDFLAKLGIKKIGKVLIDPTYGNVFINDYNGLFLFNLDRSSVTEIFPNHKLQGALACLKDHDIILAGKPGVLFSRIADMGQLTEPVLYPNTRGLCYNFITDMQASGSQLILNTDKGVFSVRIPHDSELNANRQDYANVPYKFIIRYRDTARSIGTNDTVLINQKDTRLLFDVINPLGTGKLKFAYRITGGSRYWQDLNANELDLHRLTAGNFYQLAVRASDDAWRSRDNNMILYITPYWWQAERWRKAIISGVVLLALFIIAAIIFLTRIIVLRVHSRRNLQKEIKNLHLALELRSIYAQINPHFIFNTLSTGLHFIKKGRTKEAYSHIASFSDLLRNYIKSSREKYVSIGEEIANLENYVSLQQTRFGDKFDYEIIVPPGADLMKFRIPSLLLQPIVENAIVHGLYHNEDKGHLKIEFKTGDGNEVVVIIDDDGIGRAKSRLLNEASDIRTESYGTDLIRDLVNIFNNYEQIHIDITYIDKTAPLSGTTVMLTIKNPPHE